MKKAVLLILFVHLFVVALVVVFAMRSEINYSLSSEEITEELMMMEHEMMPEQALLLLDNPGGKVLFADIRNEYEYSLGHLEQAIHLPASKIMNEEYLDMLEDYRKAGTTLVLYGNSQGEATGPYLLLRQIGFDNLKVLLGGYPYLKKLSENREVNDTLPLFIEEEPLYDFRSLIESLGGQQIPANTIASEPVIPVRRKEKTTVQGGC